ncbi:[FeFe] hydrogenase H-cluster maturation GTPase HydF [Breznakia sp. PF5-3]|uniref:[FeFe] hydrogenase H-cluster maturation GTPase HydF n=1 Tax=unclassified Breznakia TaxID=2623764 RepID=UPI0024060FAA|nr:MULTISPECIES: [FeFe] hydrogenase H-cluster maturation GTPase HydF [unclassified Breznakia]MDF9824098.1 [FeFe] hydrogenase H-cluster maturation GTPase HydF [Breznakia sp. PM6-1]MDF9834836.1 [FeFe] hydrogenase H-cluster maturation GTPase HydF [Breznakia sp. PF5-3]MDF9837142.1 [FeFe] hydrogenase H-cluster maturation GTPase HydF [Breznakia sp. PFB2-8]MDF9859067.1 [FeFe] hydrogenase H-cluster maturation GTPase HydF [Breznakia sp. PH5-24]
MSLQSTPNANRLHIGIFGKVNSGKSTLLNGLTKQAVSIVSNQEGTTTDPIYKPMELYGIGPVVFIDTAGYGDATQLGEKRLEKTKLAAAKSDIAIVVFADEDIEEGKKWYQYFKDLNIKIITIINETKDNSPEKIKEKLISFVHENLFVINARENNVEVIRKAILRLLPEDYGMESITKTLVREDDLVLLVMPQDIQAPKGRLILPQVQTIRDLLDKKSIVVSCTMDKMEEALQSLAKDPALIICDSQVFKKVYERKPKASKLTSFSILFAAYKGDINAFIEGAQAIDNLQETSKVLIAEACTHAPLSEDIGRVKIPKLLRNKVGDKLQIDVVSGNQFPIDLKAYDLIIHCGACMFNRKYVLSRLQQAKQNGVPITNYGVTIAYLNNILDKISI